MKGRTVPWGGRRRLGGRSSTFTRAVLVLACLLVVVSPGQAVEGGEGEGRDALRTQAPPPARALKPQKALSAPTRVEGTVGAWSDELEVKFSPSNACRVNFKVTGFGNAKPEDVTFEPPFLVFDGDVETRTFKVKSSGLGWYSVIYEFESDHAFPFDGVRTTVLQVLDKARVSLVQPGNSQLVLGSTSPFYKLSLTKNLNVKVVPVAEELVFEPRELSFSRSASLAPQVQEFRVRVPGTLPEKLRASGDIHKFEVPVNLVLQCNEGEEDAACDVARLHEPVEFLWQILDLNELRVEEKIVGPITGIRLPLSLKFPQEAIVEIYSRELVLSKNRLVISKEDVGVNTELRVVGRRGTKRSCSAAEPCVIQYAVKDVQGRLSPNFAQGATTNSGFHGSTIVHVVDKLELDTPNSTVAFVNQTIDLTFTWRTAVPSDMAHHQLENVDRAKGIAGGESLFEIHCLASPDVMVEPSVLVVSDLSQTLGFNITPTREGKFEVKFNLGEGRFQNLVEFKPEPVVSIIVYDSFHAEDFSFETKYGLGGLDTELNMILRRALFSRMATKETAEALGVKPVKGILLFGPPGCGKTTVARQIGRMLLTQEPKVVNGPEIISKYLGESENQVRSLFADAELDQNERNVHLIVFDEIDALVKPRGRGQGEAADQVYDGIVNTILSKMDGIHRLDNVLVVGTTNRRDLIDPALLRPGRFDVQVNIKIPDEEGRLQIFRIHTKRMFTSNLVSKDVDLVKLAKMARAFTGAEIEGVVKSAASLAVEDAFKASDSSATTIDRNRIQLTQEHFEKALKDIEPANIDSKDALEQLYSGDLFKFSPEMVEAISRFSQSLEYVCADSGGDESERSHKAISILVHGAPGTGKTSFVSSILRDKYIDNIAMLEVLSAELLLQESKSSVERKIRIFGDAFRSILSNKSGVGVLVLDDLEGIIEHVDTQAGSYINSNIFSQLRILMRSKMHSDVIIVATASTQSIMKFDQLLDLFDVEIELPLVQSRAEIKTLLALADMSSQTDYSAIEDFLPLPIKRVIKFLDLEASGNGDLLPSAGLAPSRYGEEADIGMVDVIANNNTMLKIFMI
ncbi:P-loop-containing nucleoside triphosphate hydrolase [Chloropicon primus]|uniref:P-loop-containing nucleoside triphosphate hydrolase n=1 Tax=Chloropicon primus TaxID=1764295 RepID=A0A5B8MHD8_9CHLO|nr:P-loop-containing nucleoside triphosphate hydrolase [Chloropicon primus]UPQ98715.1 P-loop-containing nucleoside triphosphate hydrolase [Chloropicon primus]|eukprot:QDZ19504.1 P-loop-containing nucleoside triphosphate hydrolase [Chloropicon primus]